MHDVLRQARVAADAGFHSVWIADHTNGFPVDRPVFEPFTTLGAISREAPGLRLGVAATDAYRRHAAVLAQCMGTLQSLSAGNAVLVLGAGEAQNLVPFGWRRVRPLARMRETIELVRRLLQSDAARQVTFDGEWHQFANAFLQLENHTIPPIYLAANGPRSRALIGEVADGWVPMMLTPELLASDLSDIRQHATDAGRDPDTIDVAYHVGLSLGDSRSEALGKLAAGSRGIVLGFPHMADRLGMPVTNELAWSTLEIQPDTQQEVAEAGEAIPDTLFERTGIYGSPDDCLEAIEAFIEAGVTEFVFRAADDIDAVAQVFRDDIFPRLKS